MAVHEATGANMTFTLQPIPVNLVDQGLAKGGNPLGLPRINHQCKFARFGSEFVGPADKKHMSVANRLHRVDHAGRLERCRRR